MSLGSSAVVSSPDVAVEAMPPVVQLIPCTACLFFFSYLDWGQFCQSWCLHCPEWLYLSGSGLGTLHFLSSPLLSVPLPPSWVPDLSISLCHPLFPPLSHLSLFHPSIFCPSTPLAQPSSPCLNFCSTPRGTAVNRQQCHIRHRQTHGGMLSANAGWLHLGSRVPVMHNR